MRSDNGEKLHWTGSRIFWVIAAVFIVAFYFFGLTIPLVGPDEPRYAQVAREMFQRGDWVTPTLVAQIGYSEWTHDDRLRHPRFLGLRDDKPARSVRRAG